MESELQIIENDDDKSSVDDLEKWLKEKEKREEEKKKREEEKRKMKEKREREEEEKREREKEEYINSKFRSENLERRKKKYIIISAAVGMIIAIIFSLMIFFYFFENCNYKIVTSNIILSVVWGCLLGIVGALSLGLSLVYFYLEYDESDIRRKIYQYEMKYIQEEIQEDIFENSIKMSSKYLDQYYEQTREQAGKGFRVTVFVSVAGALLIAFGIVAMFIGKTEPSVITCASGVITEFIAAIFFYLYNKTIVSMSKYHNKLVLSHNLSIALKVADTLPDEEKIHSKLIIIYELLRNLNVYLLKSDSENEIKPTNENGQNEN